MKGSQVKRKKSHFDKWEYFQKSRA